MPMILPFRNKDPPPLSDNFLMKNLNFSLYWVNLRTSRRRREGVTLGTSHGLGARPKPESCSKYLTDPKNGDASRQRGETLTGLF